MNVVVEGKLPELSIQVGDIVVFRDDGVYLITETYEGDGVYKYSARSLVGVGGAVGDYDNLESLRKAISKHEVQHYSKDLYEMHLVPKGERQ